MSSAFHPDQDVPPDQAPKIERICIDELHCAIRSPPPRWDYAAPFNHSDRRACSWGRQVDFLKGPDVVFHFNPRFNEQTIVRNSNLGGYWGPEEREGPFPFAEGRRFELKILVEEDMFKVAVDGTHLLEYEHRVGGLEEVTVLRVTGDVVLYSAAPSMI
ncbi:hypothetical protein CCH79_00007907 [Gambusia affinis]|uniref:Galectin n=1 Tax=Gambusia affinis TaxID=33528 RepID=A0A315W1H4_GAMAF|nr:hypothetical protein CCH79_00007907 [Gambusia affinis]